MSMWRKYGFFRTSGRAATRRRKEGDEVLRHGAPLHLRQALEASRKEDQNEDEDGEAEDVLVPDADVVGAQRFGEAEDDAAEDGPRCPIPPRMVMMKAFSVKGPPIRERGSRRGRGGRRPRRRARSRGRRCTW